MPGGGAPSAKLGEETPERDQRPYALQQHEAPLLPMPGVYREDDGADEVRPQVSVGVRLEQAELREHEGHQDEDGAGDLDGLAHGRPSGGRVGPRHGVRYGLTSQAAVTRIASGSQTQAASLASVSSPREVKNPRQKGDTRIGCQGKK